MRLSFPCLTTPFAVAAVLVLAGCGDEATLIDQTPVDTTPPATPVGLAVTATETTLVVEWDDNSEADLAGYVLEKSTDRGNTWNVVPGLLVASDYVDTYAARADYRVSAQDFTGNQSANSPAVTYLQPSDPGPKVPANPE
jgi:hypothetical protein